MFAWFYSKSLEDHLFDLQLASKELALSAKKCEKQENTERSKLVAALKKGNREVAQVYAENSIRKKNEQLNYLRMSARIDSVASRVKSASTNKQITKSIGEVVKNMESAMKTMDLEKIQKLMDRFERDFEDLDVQSSTVGNSMSSSTTLNVPKHQVEELLNEVADKAGIELNMQLPSVGSSKILNRSSLMDADALNKRLAALRN